MTTVTIREYQEEDFQQLLELNLDDQGEWFYGTLEGTLSKQKAKWEDLTPYERWLHGGWWLDPKTLKLYIEVLKKSGSKILVAEINNELVGECDFSIGFDPEFEHNRGHLMWVLTKPKYRKKGIAQKLLSKTFEYLRRKNATEVFTEAEDERSENLYKKMGFTQKTIIIKKLVNNPSSIDGEVLEKIEEKYEIKKIKFREIPFEKQIRILGTYYTPIYDVIRSETLPRLYEILGVPIPSPTAIMITDISKQTKYYAIIDQNPRLWVPRNTPKSTVAELVTLILSESYYDAHGPELLLQYYSKNKNTLDLINNLEGKVETLPLYSKYL